MLINLNDYCRLRYGLAKAQQPTKAQRNAVSEMCRTGTLDAFKSGNRWIIRLEDCR